MRQHSGYYRLLFFVTFFKPDLVIDGDILVEEDRDDVPHVVSDLLSCKTIEIQNSRKCKSNTTHLLHQFPWQDLAQPEKSQMCKITNSSVPVPGEICLLQIQLSDLAELVNVALVVLHALLGQVQVGRELGQLLGSK